MGFNSEIKNPNQILKNYLQAELQDIMEELDTDKSGGVDFSEFLQFMTK